MPKKPTTKRSIKAKLSKERIFTAAIDLISSKGFERTSIKDIVAKAGVSIGTFYHHFSSKNGILEEDFRRADRLFEELAPTIDPNLQIDERVLRYMDRYSKLLEDNGVDFDRQLYNCKNTLFIKKGRAMQTGLVSIIKDGQRKGELDDSMSAEDICDYIFIATRGVVFDWCLHNGKSDIKSFLRGYLSRLLGIFHRDGACLRP